MARLLTGCSGARTASETAAGADDVVDEVSDVLDPDDDDDGGDDGEGDDEAEGLLPGLPLPDDLADRLPGAADGESPAGLPGVEGILPGVSVPVADSEPRPPGATDGECEPSEDKPHPVVLVHGTFAGRFTNWSFMSPALKDEGYCVYALDYGRRATQDIEDSAEMLDDFVDDVLAKTGAEKVSILGHSQGGLMPRYYLKRLGGAAKVDDMVSLAASNHGTDLPLASLVALPACPACRQQVPYQRESGGSSFVSRLNEGDETFGDVSYTQITTRFDQVIPYFSAFLADDPGDPNGPRTAQLNGPDTTNYCLQDEFRANIDDHVRIAFDPDALRILKEALENDGRPAEPPDDLDGVCAGGRGSDGDGGGSDDDGDEGSSGNGKGNGSGGDDDRDDDESSTPASPIPGSAPLGPLAPTYCLPRVFRQNFAPAGSRAHRACLAAADRARRLSLPASVACEQAGLSRRRVRGERRSDHAACVLALTGIRPGQPPL